MKRKRVLCALTAVAFWMVCSALPSFAQPAQPGSDQGPRGPGGPPGGGGPGGPGGFTPFFGGGMIGLAARDEVQQELQLVDEQKDKVRAITDDMRTKIRDQMRDAFNPGQNQSDEDRRARFAEIRTKMESLNADMEKQLEAVLLPHQLERLKQIQLQSQVQQRGASALTSGDVAKALNLTDDQREKLEKRAAEVQDDLQKQIRQLQADARKKMLDVLTSDQRAQLDKMMGQQFDLPDPNFGGGFRGRFRGRGGAQPGGQPGQPPTRPNNQSI